MGFLGSSDGKESSNAGDLGSIPGLERSPRGGQTTPVFLPGESPWAEEPGGLQSMGLHRVGHACSDLAHMHGSEETEERQGQSLQGGRRWGNGMGEGAKGEPEAEDV